MQTDPLNAILLLGPTGSGKSPLGDQIASRGFHGSRCLHLDFGCELRSLAAGCHADSFSSAERDFIIDVLERGILLENEHFPLAKKIIRLFLERSGFLSDDTLVLNGLPRHVGQANDLCAVAAVHTVIVLDCSAATVFRRIRENTGGDRSGREDDEIKLIEKKLALYAARTTPLIEYYGLQGSRICHIPIDEKTSAHSAYLQLTAFSASGC